MHAGKAARSKDREIIDAINQSLRPADKGLRPLHLMDLRVAGIPLATARTLIHSLDALKAVQDAAAKAATAALAASRAARAPAAAGSVPPAGGAVASEACNAFLYPPPGSSSSELHIGGVSQAYFVIVFVFVFIFVFRRRVTQARTPRCGGNTAVGRHGAAADFLYRRCRCAAVL